MLPLVLAGCTPTFGVVAGGPSKGGCGSPPAMQRTPLDVFLDPQTADEQMNQQLALQKLNVVLRLLQ